MIKRSMQLLFRVVECKSNMVRARFGGVVVCVGGRALGGVCGGWSAGAGTPSPNRKGASRRWRCQQTQQQTVTVPAEDDRVQNECE